MQAACIRYSASVLRGFAWQDVTNAFAKASNMRVKEQLLSTGDAILIEGNTWNDRYWGVDARSCFGKNHLGKILMKVRSELKANEG